MKKEYWIYFVVVALIASYFVFWNIKDYEKDLDSSLENSYITPKKDSVSKTNTTTQKVASVPVKTESFTNIFPQKGNYECQYEENIPGKRTTNTVYFSDGRMRGEFRTVGATANLMVYDGYYLYTWLEGKGVGTVSKPKSTSDFPYIVPKDFTQGKVLSSGDSSVSWQCHAWIKDPKVLEKPSYVSFN